MSGIYGPQENPMKHLLSMVAFASFVNASTALAQCPPTETYPFGDASHDFNGTVRCMLAADTNGAGPQPSRLVIGGDFHGTAYAGDYIGVWNGASWSSLGWGTDGPVTALATWDPDGDGPVAPRLIAAGSFQHVGSDSTGEVSAQSIASWDGTAWRALGAGLDGTVYAMASWDPDGPGPRPPLLIVGGDFLHVGGVFMGPIAAWDGTQWRGLGWGLNHTVRSLAVWDRDGDGPGLPVLVAGGDFTVAGSDSTGEIGVANIAQWDGVAWRGLAQGASAPVRSLLSWRTAPGTWEVVAGGDFGVMRWDGSVWRAIGNGLTLVTIQHYPHPRNTPYKPPYCDAVPMSIPGSALSLSAVDIPGNPESEQQLFVAAEFTFFQDACCDYKSNCWGCNCTRHDVGLLVWDHSEFVMLFPESIDSILSVGSGSPAGQLAGLLISQFYPHYGGPRLLARIESYEAPRLVPESQFVAARVHDRAVLRVTPTQVPFDTNSYRWNHYAPSYPTLSQHQPSSSSTYETLILDHIDTEDAGDYVASAYIACRLVMSPPIRLTILPGSCTADFNHDGDSGTDADIEAFFACLAGACCPTCGDIDFNGDGDAGTDADIESFFRVLAGNPC